MADVISGPAGGAPNTPLTFAFDGPVAPLSVTRASVSVTTPDGVPVPWTAEVQGPDLSLRLVVDSAFLERAPDAVEVTLAGLPSASAVTLRDGRRLARTVVARVPLGAGLEAGGASPARLLSVDGRALPLPPTVARDGSLVFVFDGVLDPATLAVPCPLWPLLGEVHATPVASDVRWSVSGTTTEVVLDPPATADDLEFAMRRAPWRDLRGESPEPALVVTLSRP